jgi:hypothetical protein
MNTRSSILIIICITRTTINIVFLEVRWYLIFHIGQQRFNLLQRFIRNTKFRLFFEQSAVRTSEKVTKICVTKCYHRQVGIHASYSEISGFKPLPRRNRKTWLRYFFCVSSPLIRNDIYPKLPLIRPKGFPPSSCKIYYLLRICVFQRCIKLYVSLFRLWRQMEEQMCSSNSSYPRRSTYLNTYSLHTGNLLLGEEQSVCTEYDFGWAQRQPGHFEKQILLIPSRI